MTPEEIAARKAEILAEIEKYTNILSELEPVRTSISDKQKVIKEDVKEKIDSYDIHEDTKWKGKNSDDAVDKKDNINSLVGSFNTSVLTLLSQIDTSIREIQAKIEHLYMELASLG